MEYIDTLKNITLFKNFQNHEYELILKCLNAKIINAKKDDILLSVGDYINYVGIVLSGSVHIVKDDINGERVIVAVVAAGELFSEALCCARVYESPVTVISAKVSTIMLIEFRKVLDICSNVCEFHTRLIENMLGTIAIKNLKLQNRLDFISKKTLRAKILCYLESFCNEKGSSFNIPLSREQMSEFLCTDRSALSHELARMKREGILDYHKNSFKLF